MYYPARCFSALVLLSLFLVLLSTCGSADKRSETDDLGYRTDYRVNKKTGLKEGKTSTYAPDGTLLSEEYYEAGELEGERLVYYPDGSIDIRETYRQGKFDGPYTTYDSLGNPKFYGVYSDNTMQGKWYRLYPDGGLEEEVTFVNNTEDGPFREWYANGQPKAAGTYIARGKEQGTLWMFDESGQLEFVKECVAAVCTTVWRASEGGTPPAPAPDMTRPTVEVD